MSALEKEVRLCTREGLVELGKELYCQQREDQNRREYLAELKQLFAITKKFDPVAFETEYSLNWNRAQESVRIHELLAHIKVHRLVYDEKQARLERLRQELDDERKSAEFSAEELERQVKELDGKDAEIDELKSKNRLLKSKLHTLFFWQTVCAVQWAAFPLFCFIWVHTTTY